MGSFGAPTNETMTDMNAGTMGTAPARPTMLTVICILSFIMGAWGIWGGIQNLTMDKEASRAEAEAKLADAKAQMGDNATGLAARMMDSAMEITEKSIDNAMPIGVCDLVLSLISVLGVWMMWNLRKSGFWLYLLATIGGLVVPLVFLGGGMLALLSVGFMGLISIVFVILYAVNLKYMH